MTDKTQLNFSGEEIDEILSSIDGHISTTREQTLTTTEKARVRSTIGAQENVDSIDTVPQSKSSIEQATARNNINAINVNEIEELKDTLDEVEDELDNCVDTERPQALDMIERQNVRESLGLILPERTDKMILPVGRDENGKLWTYGIKSGGGSDLDPTTWEGIGNIIELGLAPEFWDVGDQLGIISNNVTYNFDILDFDYDTPIDTNVKHTMTVASHDIMYYPSSPWRYPNGNLLLIDGLPAGDYHWLTSSGSIYSFRSSSNCPADSVLGYVDSNIKLYTRDGRSKAFSTSKDEEWGIFLGTIGGSGHIETIDIDGNSYRILFNINSGNLVANDWANSFIRFQINSTGLDRPGLAPINTLLVSIDSYTTRAFYKYLEEGCKNLIVPVKKRTSYYDIFSNPVGASTKLGDENLFLLSTSEVFGSKVANQFTTSFGTDRTFTTPMDRSYSFFSTASNRKKYKSSTARGWWLRDYASSVNTTGNKATATMTSTSMGTVIAFALGK